MRGRWFPRNWMYAGLIAGLFLLAIAPILGRASGAVLLLFYLQLPIYMLHQLEEHDHDRFRQWANRVLAGGREALSTRAVVIINVGGVWVVDLIALYLARFVDVGLGLIAVYLSLINGVVHVIGGIVLRAYNPGLATAVLLFLPLGTYTLVLVSDTPGISGADHALAVAFAVLLHVSLFVHLRRRVAALSKVSNG